MALTKNYSFNKVAPRYRKELVDAWVRNGKQLRQGDVKAYTENQQEALSTVKTLDELKSMIGYSDKDAVDSAPAISKFAA